MSEVAEVSPPGEQKQNERLKRKLNRARARLEEANKKIERLEKQNREVQEELEALRAVVEVYDKNRGQADEKRVTQRRTEEEADDDEDFEEDVESFDKTSTRDDGHLSRQTKPKISADKYSMDLMRSSASARTTAQSPSLLDSGGGPEAPSTSTQTRQDRSGSLDIGHRASITSNSSITSTDDPHDKISPKITTAASRPKRRDVPLSQTAAAGRKWNTARDIGVSLSKEDERELFGTDAEAAASSSSVRSSLSSESAGLRSSRPGLESSTGVRHPSTSTAPNPTLIVTTGNATAHRRSKSRVEDASTSPPPDENPSMDDSPPVHRDQPKIFDENTVRDILCGLSITSSRTFKDDLLVPADYSYSYQFKVRRVPTQLLKFKDFAPKVFHQIRQHWGISNTDLMLSFSYDNLDAIRGEGKSGAFFIFTRDKRFILKTSTGPERDFLWEMLPYYFLYIRKNPHTLLPRFYGVYSMKHEGIGGMVRFVVMNNWFATPSPLNEVYDLKGSTLGRSSGEEPKPGSLLKDLDIKRKLYMDDPIKKLFLDQLYQDSQFLAQHNVMDYSLLVGVHYDTEEGRAARDRKAAEWAKLYPEDTSFQSIYQSDEGGLAGWNDEENRREVYYIGIIDILQKYTSAKKIEHLLKSIPFKAATVSVVEPSYYAKRFHAFISGVSAVSSKCVSRASEAIEPDTTEVSDTEDNEESASEDTAAASSSAASSLKKTATSSGENTPKASVSRRSGVSKSKPAKSPRPTSDSTSPPPAADGSASASADPAATVSAPKPKKKKKKVVTSTEDLSESSEELVPTKKSSKRVESPPTESSSGPSKSPRKTRKQ